MDCRRKRYSRNECARWNNSSGHGGHNVDLVNIPVGPFSAAIDPDAPRHRYGRHYDDCGCGCGTCRRLAPIPPCHEMRPGPPPPNGWTCPDYYGGPLPPSANETMRNRRAYRNRQRRGGPNERFNECADAFFSDFGCDLNNAATDAEIERKLHMEKFMRAECGQWLDDCFGDGSKRGMKLLESIREGDILIYRGCESVKVMKVYSDELAPYFDVRLANGQIIQTEAKYLEPPPCTPPSRFNCSGYPHYY